MKIDDLSGTGGRTCGLFFCADVRACGGSRVRLAIRVYGKLGGIDTTCHLSGELDSNVLTAVSLNPRTVA